MSIIDTNPHRVDVSPGLREMLMRNGIQARVTFDKDGKPVLVVKGHDSPVLEYRITDRQLNDLMSWSSSYQSVNRQAYNTFVGIVKNDFDCPGAFVYAKNAFSSVATGLHGYRIGVGEYGNFPRFHGGWRDRLYGPGSYLGAFRPALLWGGGGPFHGRRIGGQYFANYARPWVPERPDGRIKPGEMTSGGYGFYWKGERNQNKPDMKVENIQPVELKPAPRDKNVTKWYSTSAWSKSHWNDVLDSHGIVVDEKKGTITVQSRALRADVTFSEKDDPKIKDKIKVIMAEDIPTGKKKGGNKNAHSVEERINLINSVIGTQFKDKLTLDMLKKGEMIGIEAKPECKAVIEKAFIEQDNRKLEQQRQEVRQNQIQYAEELYKKDIDRDRYRIYNDPAAVNGREIAYVLGEKGWFVNRDRGRELNVGEIRVDKVEGKYYMSADVNGEVMLKEINAKSYAKFLNYDDKHRMKMFAATFDEIKIDDAAVEGGRDVYEYGNESAFINKMPISYDDRLNVIQGRSVDAQTIADYASSMGVAVNTEAFQIGVNPNPEVYQTEVVQADAEKMNILKGNNFDPYNGGMTVQQRLDFLNSFDKSGTIHLDIDGLTRFSIDHQNEITGRDVKIKNISIDELQDISEARNIEVKPATVEVITNEETKSDEVLLPEELAFTEQKPSYTKYTMANDAAEYFNQNGMVQRNRPGREKEQVTVENLYVKKSDHNTYMLYAEINGVKQKAFISSDNAEKFARSDNMGKMEIACKELRLEVAERAKVYKPALDALNGGQFITDSKGEKAVAVKDVTAEKTQDGKYTLSIVTAGEDGKDRKDTFSLSKNEYKQFSQGDTAQKINVIQKASEGKYNFSERARVPYSEDGVQIYYVEQIDEISSTFTDKDSYQVKIGDTKVHVFTDPYDKTRTIMAVLADGGVQRAEAISDKDFQRFVKGSEEKRRDIIAKYFTGDIDLTRLNKSEVYNVEGAEKDCSVSFRKGQKDLVMQVNIGDEVFINTVTAKEHEQFRAANNEGKTTLVKGWIASKNGESETAQNVQSKEEKAQERQEKRGEEHSEGKVSDSVDGASLKDVNAKKGWFREGSGGREVTVGEIRVERLPGQDKDGNSKYTMSAVINGEVVTHEISQKQYDKFLAMDDGGRMKYFAKVFPEVDLKTLPGQKEDVSIWEGKVSDSVDGASLKDVNAKKGWFREGSGGREVTVGEIRVERLPGQDKDGNSKYTMSAVINGEVVTHEISQKQYDKFLAMDDGGRMKYFAKVFPEVDLKTLPGQKTNIGKAILNGLACVGGLTLGVLTEGVAMGLGREHRHHMDVDVSLQGFHKPGVADGRVLVVSDARNMAAANFNDADDRNRQQDMDIDKAKGMSV